MPDTSLVPSFSVCHLAWYAAAHRRIRQSEPEILVCNADPGGGVEFEFALRWYDLGGKLAMRVEVFDDALAAFVDEPFVSMLRGLAALPFPVTPDSVTAYLLRCGFVDRTEYVDPNATPDQEATRSAADKAIAELEGALRVARKSIVPRDRP